MQALLLAAGRGEGLLPYTLHVQKEAIRITGRAIVSFPVVGLKEAGVSEFVVVVNERASQVEEALEELDVSYELVVQKSPGLEGAVKDGLKKVSGDQYVLAFGDIVAPKEFYRGLINALSTGKDAVVSLVPVVKGEQTYGTVTVEGGQIRIGRSQLALGGAYVLPRVEFDNIYSFFEQLSREGRVEFFVWSGVWLDIGFPEDLVVAIQELLEGKDSVISKDARLGQGVVIKNSVIEEGTEIENYAVIKNSYVGRNAYVGDFALVRSFSSLEEGSHVGAYAEIAHSLVGRKAKVGSRVYLSYTVVGDEAEVGASVITVSYPGRPVRGKEAKLGALISPKSKVEHGRILPAGFKG
ncbi:MAG: sugar phosphate nucleotidyltransferase [Thermoprotei archaeon]